MEFYNTLTPYETLERDPIRYGVCRSFDHISRYSRLRQVIHNSGSSDSFVALETPNAFNSNADVEYYEVPASEENRLDIIANKFLGSASYSWVIAYFNDIADGFTVQEGQKLKIPKQFTSLFNSGEMLQSVSAYRLNLYSE